MRGRYESHSAQDTESLGARLASTLSAGEAVLLAGELGSGKTTFVRGACRRLGVSVPVTSPTFTIGQRYPAPIDVAHIDLYRVTSLGDEDPDLLADYLGTDTITFVEWPGDSEPAVSELVRIAARVHLEHAGGDARVLSFS